jgi:hypothetical protein
MANPSWPFLSGISRLSWVVLSCFLATVRVGSAAPGGVIAKDRVAGGEHWRLQTEGGWVHVWRPAGYDRRTAGTVVYVHGFTVDVDGAWEHHDLAKQFEKSRRNAVFVIPEAPTSAEDTVRWPSLNRLLTVRPWLKNPRVGHVLLLDALYGPEIVEALRAWLRTGRGRLALVAAETTDDAERLVHGLQGVVRRATIPESGSSFSLIERRARVAYLRSQYSHLEMVTEGKTIAPLLSLTRLPVVVVAPPQTPRPKPRPPQTQPAKPRPRR